jgi:hypothetical protein
MEQIASYNTELEIDIRLLKDKFHQLTERERLLLVESLNDTDERSETPAIGNYRVRDVEDFEPTDNTPADSDDLAAVTTMEQFESVWAMPDDDDIEEDQRDLAEQRNSFSSLVAEQEAPLEDDGGLTRGAVAGIAAGGAALAGGTGCATARSTKDDCDRSESGAESPDHEFYNPSGANQEDNVPCGFDDTSDLPEEPMQSRRGPFSYSYPVGAGMMTPSGREYGRGYASSLSDDELSTDEVHRLQQRIEFDDLKALEMEASKLAEEFKLKSTHQLESISDVQVLSSEKPSFQKLQYARSSKVETLNVATAVSPARTTMTTSTLDMNDTYDSSSSTETGVGPSAGESSGDFIASEPSDRMANSPGVNTSPQTAGEPSGDTPPAVPPESFDDSDDYYEDELTHSLPMQYMTQQSAKPPRPSSAMSTRKDSVTNRSDPKPYLLNEWSAMGDTGGILGDMSDSQSTSTDSYLDSGSSVDALSTTPCDETGDSLLNQTTSTKTQPGRELQFSMRRQEDVKPGHSTSIEEKRRKKRELEAWKNSLNLNGRG